MGLFYNTFSFHCASKSCYHYHLRSKKLKKNVLVVCKEDICNASCITNVNLEEAILEDKAGRHGSTSLLKERNGNYLITNQLLGGNVG